MPNLSDFMNSLFGECQGPISFETNGDVVDTDDRAFVKQNAGDLYFRPMLPDRTVSMVWKVLEGIDDPEAWQDAQRTPTAVLYHPEKQKMIALWAIEAPFPIEEVQPLADELAGDLEAYLPTPGTEEWECVHADANTFYALDELLDVYGPELPDMEDDSGHDPDIDDQGPVAEIVEEKKKAKPSPDIAGHSPDIEPAYFADALIATPGYDPNTDPLLAREIMISRGANAESKSWKPTLMPLGAFIASLCIHKEGPKNGPAFVCGEVVGDRRTQNAMRALYAVGLDIDVGMSAAELDVILEKLGCLAVRYSTHSHLSTLIEVSKDKLTKFAAGREIDTDVCQDYLRSVGYVEEIAGGATYSGVDHGERGIVVSIITPPIPKMRVVIPFDKPFIVADEGATQREAIEKWQRVPEYLAEQLGIPIDKTGKDASRLFYYGRHKKGRPYEAALFGGKLFDWRSLDLNVNEFGAIGEAMGAKSTSKSKTEHGLGKWSVKRAHGFQIVDVLEDFVEDKIRSDASSGVNIECPHDELHNNAGDPEDQACYAVNAGDGKSEFFTIKCQHESCRDFTNLDMLGKMIKDQWFSKDVLEDERYNAAAPEDAPNPEAAVRITEQDNAKQGLPAMIEALDKDCSGEELAPVIAEIVKLGDQLETEKAILALKAKTGLSVQTLRKQVTAAKRETGSAKGPKEIIDAKGRVTFRYYSEFNNDEAVDAVRKAMLRANRGDPRMPEFTCALDSPMRLRRSKDDRLQFVEMDTVGFWTETCKRVFFQRETDHGTGVREAVPKDVAAQVQKSSWETLPQTPEIIYTPIFTAEGELIREPGWYYDPANKAGINILMADTGFEVPAVSAQPTDAEIDAAVSFLRNEVFVDFPFLDMTLDGEERREPSEANAMAMLITPFMRRMINGCTPVFFITKPAAGSGGTLLGKIPMLIFDGEESFPMSYHRDNDDEQRKALLSAVMETRSHLFFDDVKEFNSRVILQSVTARKIGGRILGQSVNAERDNVFNWIGTGNNTYILSEMARRICWIRINAKTADIQERTYRHEDYIGFLRDERATIVHAILTLIQAWISAGGPRFVERKLASFEEWAAMVGGVLQFAGVEGFLDNRRPVDGDVEQANTRAFVKHWIGGQGMGYDTPITSAALFSLALDLELEILEGNTDDQKKHRFRRKLESMEGQTFDIGGHQVIVRKTIDGDGVPAFALKRLGIDEPE